MPTASPYLPHSGQLRQRGVWTISLIRICFGAACILILDHIVDLGTSPWLLIAATALGVLAASRWMDSRLTTLGFGCSLLGVYLLFLLFFKTILTALPQPHRVFWWYALELHLQLVLFLFIAGAFSTWCFFRFKHALSLEVILIGAAAVYLLSAHRHYRFDLVQIVNNLAWRYQLSPLAVLVWLGVAVFVSLVLYLVAAAIPAIPHLARRQAPTIMHHGRPNLTGAVILVALMILLLSLIAVQTYQRYLPTATALTQNGVGDTYQEGLSPLTFQSALGSSNQPSAVVRLDGDLRYNPHTPMLYLRESALSLFNGRELVAADATYDRDVSNTKPSQTFSAAADPALDLRTPITQSVYLLTDHNLAFGIDYPIYITTLKIPSSSSRFRGAFRVYSMAPAFSMDEIKNLPVGDPRWSAAQLQHYLTPHPDPRYRDLAATLTKDITSPVRKAIAIAEYLSKNATYTLTPHHQIKEGDDPVAPFLFGDLRGYCVHFAHAIAFMLRSLGIPARIATGYLTDLSQSKDGHILLRVNDRHAWAEAYVTGRGWVPFDVKPEKVESHAETPVDMALLEELMGLLGPGEEILSKDVATDEGGMHPRDGFMLPRLKDLAMLLILLAAALTLFKVFLLYAWWLPAPPALRLKRAYRGWLVRLYDMGMRRGWGETREEFSRRLLESLGVDLTCATENLNNLKYSHTAMPCSPAELKRLNMLTLQSLRNLPTLKRALGMANPSSIIAMLGGSKW